MKEATGELNMTVITIVAIGAIIGLFWALWPSISGTINDTWTNISGSTNSESSNCGSGAYWNGTACVTVK